MPRVAISVDMLDTGIDVREIVNLSLQTCIFLHQILADDRRGTRLLEAKKQNRCTQKIFPDY